jgi:hypothetical protein
VLELRSTAANRVDPQQPQYLLLAIPLNLGDAHYWELRATLREGYHRGEGEKGLSSGFVQGLLLDGYEPLVMENFISGDLQFDLSTSSTLEISRAVLSHKGAVRAATLNMHDVLIEGAQLDIHSAQGTWEAVRGAGKQTRVTGCLGVTRFGKSCRFNECSVLADLRAAHIEAPVVESFPGCLVDMDLIPQAFDGRVKQISAADSDLREQHFRDASYRKVSPIHPGEARDRRA